MIVVNKIGPPADRHDGARDPRRPVARARRPRGACRSCKTEAARGEGVEELVEKIEEHRAHIEAEGTLEERRRRNLMNEVLELAAVRLRRKLEESIREDPSVQELLDEVVQRQLDPASAAAKLLEREL